MNTNNATLSTNEVQNIRDLIRAGFCKTTIARAFGVCGRTVEDIDHQRSWRHVPDVPAPLPLLACHAAAMLRLRSFKRLTDEQRQNLTQYAHRVGAQIEAEAEREPFALDLLSGWKPVQPVRQINRVRGLESSAPCC